jgi:hypothetical protein
MGQVARTHNAGPALTPPRRRSMPPSRERIRLWVPTAGSCPVFRSAERFFVLPDNRSVTVFRRVVQLLYAALLRSLAFIGGAIAPYGAAGAAQSGRPSLV